MNISEAAHSVTRPNLAVPVALAAATALVQALAVLMHPHHAPLQGATAVLLVVQARCMIRRVSTYRHQAPQRAIAGAASVLALGLGVDAVLHSMDLGVGHEAGFVVGSVLASVLAFHGVLLWDRLGSGVPDLGDWTNALGMIAVVVSAGLLVTDGRLLDTAGWTTAEEVVVLVQVAVGMVLLLACLSVGLLAGMGPELRLWAVMVVVAAVVVAQLIVVRSGFHALQLVSSLGQVVVCSAAVVALHRPLPSRRTEGERPPLTTSWSLALTAAACLVLLAALLTGAEDARAAGVVAGVAALLGIARTGGIVREIQAATQSRMEARTDELTGLGNRRRLARALEDAMAELAAGEPVSLLAVDLRGFRDVNDRFGPAAGDAVLRAMAARMREQLPERMVSRISGDQFMVVLHEPEASDPATTADGLVLALERPVEVGAATLRLRASIGVAQARPADDLAGADELLRRAHVAMHVAKRAERHVAYYDPNEEAAAHAARERVEELTSLLAPDPDPRVGHLVVHYQPQLDLRTGRVVGAEALVRWDHPVHGLLYPDAFVDLVERHGLMRPLTETVLTLAAAQSAAWERAGTPLRVSVNLSSSLFLDWRLEQMVHDALEATGASAQLVALEITESVLMENAEAVPRVLDALADRAVSLSIDDFGTGYSSLSYLSDLPVDELKIDRSFVQRMRQDERTHAVVAGTIDLAHRLGLRVVAEGVEDQATLEALRELECDVTQGYLHSRPVEAEALRGWLDEHAAAVG
ncbi:putative bifunctional diguanylate cyclase/phosphodiesterase [Aeromicrobium massiliense]|uniref:putative bifunctional diguanylate cyclase/phosphodiesterase n=1 Tax=Aeromicrobium massiliense TaxID=1464554 RepID=UPI00067668CC|nr:bifunctional diguanylate cyclase/phosphodiesterase [Aeromicrobium massiliense]